MPVHGIDNGNNKHEVYTTEELLSILQQAINSGSLQGIDPTQTPIVAAVRESHNNSNITFWSGTEAEFNELTGVTSELVGARIGSDGKLYILTGDTTLSDTIQACYDAALEATEGMKREVISVTLMANAWSDTAPYTQTVGVAGMTADKDFLAPYVVPTGNESDDLAAQAALSCISGGTTDTDSVTFYCYDEKPTTTITVFMVDKGTKIEPGGYPIASKTAPGIMQVGDGLNVDSNGKVSAEAIEEKSLKFHSVAASSATYIAELPNGKNILVDTGLSSQWSSIKAAIDGLGITKFDYAIITHFHADHSGNIQNFIDNYDMSQCIWYIQMKPDFVNHAEDFSEPESYYDDTIALFTSNGITPVVPANNATIVVDEENDISLRFLNTDASIAENYYGRLAEWKDGEGINYNAFSLITEIIHKDVRILTTGDIERPVEEQYASYLSKINVMTVPHHGTNQDADKAFYYTTMPDYAICSYPSSSDVWVRSWYKSFGYLKEVGSKLISERSSGAVNGLFSFKSDGRTVSTTVKYSAITESIFNYNNLYQVFESLVKWTSQDADTITLEQMLANLPIGFTMTDLFSSASGTKYPQILSDLQAIFGTLFATGTYVTIENQQLFHRIKIFDYNKSFEAIRYKTASTWNLKGEGNLGTLGTKTALLNKLTLLPIGHYTVAQYTESDSSVLLTDGSYVVSVDIVKHDTITVGKLSATLRDNQGHSTDRALTATSYYRSDQSPYIYWRKTS